MVRVNFANCVFIDRLSPRAVADVSRPRMRTLADGRTIPDAMSLDWSDLVHVATKAIESKQTSICYIVLD